MKREEGKNSKSRTSAKGLQGETGLSHQGDGHAIVDRSLACALVSRASDKRPLRSQLFARRLAAKHLLPFRAGLLDFLYEIFGGKFSSTETTRLAGEKFYLRPGKEARRSTADAAFNLALSLSFNKLSTLSFNKLSTSIYPRPAESPLAVAGLMLHREVLRREAVQPMAASYGKGTPELPQRATRHEREPERVLRVYERASRGASAQAKPESVGRLNITAGHAGQFVPLALSFPPGRSSQHRTHNAQTLLTWLRAAPSYMQRAMGAQSFTPHDSQQAGAPPQYSITNLYVSPRTTLERTGKRENALTLPLHAPISVFHTARQERQARGGPFDKSFMLPVTTRLLRSESLEFIRRALSLRGALEEGRASESIEMKDVPRLLSSRQLMRLPDVAMQQRRGMSKMSGAGPLFVEQRLNLERVLVALRRETKLELPPVAQVFAPPQRPLIEARSAVKQVEEKEVIEVVKREVRTQMKSHSAVANFTRADFTFITDHVYDVLARRLLMEKERLGLSS
ncbi:MAG TPA: hypothetical protein VF553_19130 [Pyrinomonadaceae bacterium]|jgi:hypothetical protein